MKHLRPWLSQNSTKRNEWGNVVCSTHTRIYYMVCALWSQIAPMFSLCDLSYVSVWIMRVWVAKWVNIDIPTLFSCFRNATATTFFSLEHILLLEWHYDAQRGLWISKKNILPPNTHYRKENLQIHITMALHEEDSKMKINNYLCTYFSNW